MRGYAGNGNISSDPLFVSASDYHLQPASPCAGAGDAGGPNVDIEGSVRPQPLATNSDMGAYEVDQLSDAVHENLNDQELKIYPNPSSGNFTLSSNAEIKAEIKIVNALGELVYSGSFSGKQKTIDVNAPAGIYSLQLVTGDKYFVRKIIRD